MMAKSTKERQQKYRERQRLGNLDRRVNLWINAQAYGALERLADHFGIPKRQVIEDLIVILDTDVSKMTELDLSG